MGLILGVIAVIAGAIGIKWSFTAIVAGVVAIMAFFGIKRD